MKTICMLLLILVPVAGAFAQNTSPAPGEEKEVSGVTFVWCPPGSFEMGNSQSPKTLARLYGGKPEWYADSGPSCTVNIQQGFWIGKYEVTTAQWNLFAEERYRRAVKSEDEENTPVTSVSIPHIQTFFDTINANNQGTFRLPSEIEWEYACRAGSTAVFYSGDDTAALPGIAWFAGNARPAGLESPQPVGIKTPNNWGIHDMLGNAWEWCGSPYTQELPCAGGKGPSDAGVLAIRGGSIRSTEGFLRCATRMGQKQAVKNDLLGFRLIWEP